MKNKLRPSFFVISNPRETGVSNLSTQTPPKDFPQRQLRFVEMTEQLIEKN